MGVLGRVARAGRGCAVVLGLLLGLGAPASAATLFWEDFDGYTHFPDEIPENDPVNQGVPKVSEGADQTWYGARFETPDSTCGDGTIHCDLAVQKFGGGSNSTKVGRFEDDAGLLFRVDTTNWQDIAVSYQWRTFRAESNDELVAGYFVGDIPLSVFGSDLTADLVSHPSFKWTNWVEMDRDAAHSTWTTQSFMLPSDVGLVWVAFWLDNGEGDYGKLDNVQVSANTLIPEPATALLCLAGLAALAGWRRRLT
jgi:hypothetical protein